MNSILLVKMLHVIAVGFFGGSLLAMMMVQSLLHRSLEDGERKSLARAGLQVARLLVVPLMYAGFLLGAVLMWQSYSAFGIGKLMSCTPIYVHVMLGMGILALGFAQVWKARTRKLSHALDAGVPFAEARAHLLKGWIFAGLALFATLIAFWAGIQKVPNPARLRCVPPGVTAPA